MSQDSDQNNPIKWQVTDPPQRRIRVIAIGIFLHEDHIFVFEGYDYVKKETFYRPLGGEVELGERGMEALTREIREEIQAEIEDIRCLGMIENIFTLNGGPGHEIVLVYSARFRDEKMYDTDRVVDGEEEAGPIRAAWIHLDKFRTVELILYPAGLLAFMRTSL